MSIPFYRQVGFRCLISLALFGIGTAFADGGLGSVADNIVQEMSAMAKMVTAVAYVGGLGFAVGAVLKFKAHRDNPTQIPVGTPLALLFVAVAMMFLPSLFNAASKSIFGSSAKEVGTKGTDTLSGGGS